MRPSRESLMIAAMNTLLWKRWILGSAEYCQLNALSRGLHRSSLAVLCYHGVVEKDRGTERILYGNTVSIAEFRGQLEYVAKRFNPITGAQLVAALMDGRPLPIHPVLVNPRPITNSLDLRMSGRW